MLSEKENVHALKLKGTWVMQQDNVPKHTRCGLVKSLDSSQIEMGCHDLKQAICTRKLQHYSHQYWLTNAEEWGKISPQ